MDIPCGCCGEPYDAYGVFHGDLKSWEKDLFIAGSGCPCCEGHVPAGMLREDKLIAQAKAVMIGGAWDDPHKFSSVNNLGLDYTPPEWKRPDDPVIHTCEQCAGEIRQNIDEDLSIYHPRYHSPEAVGLYWAYNLGRYKEMYNHGSEWEECLVDCLEQTSHGSDKSYFNAKLKDKATEEWTIDGKFFCPGCVERCGDCNALCFNEELMLPEGKIRCGEALCEECYDKNTCSECHYTLDHNESDLCSTCKENDEDEEGEDSEAEDEDSDV